MALARRSGPLRVRASVYYGAAASLLDALRTGETAFETIYGQPFFSHLDANPEAQGSFDASMAGRAVAEASDVVAAFDFGSYRTIVDVGGGSGILLAAILGAVPQATGVLLDRPAPVGPPVLTSPMPASPAESGSLPATSSTRCLQAATRMSWHGSCTTGTMPTRCGSSTGVGRRWCPATACW